MKLRKCLYNKAKRTVSYTDWCDYKQVKNKVNSLLESAHQNYCSDLFNDTSKSKKRFWSYIKTKSKDNMELYHLNMERQPIPLQNKKLIINHFN